jgi:hypothetical protein
MGTNTNTSIPQPPSGTEKPPRITDFSFTSTEPLPANYTRELDPSGRPFYRNKDDNSVSWYHPAATPPAQDPQLPRHIERCVDVRGRSYYINHETKTTSWLNPLKVDEFRARENPTVLDHTEDGRMLYWVNYEADTVTVPQDLAELRAKHPWIPEKRGVQISM